VLAFLMEGVEEIEFVTPVDIWRRAGFEVTVASLGYFFCARAQSLSPFSASQSLSLLYTAPIPMHPSTPGESSRCVHLPRTGPSVVCPRAGA
jgi:hypothetical protein